MDQPAASITATGARQLDLRIMATSDVHMHLLAFNHDADPLAATTGLAHTATLIRSARKEAANTILLDNGDFLHGSTMAEAITHNVLDGRREPRGLHPIVAAMRALGYDAMTLGNHDFDHGVEFLGQVLRNAPFTVVASNISLLPTTGSGGPRPMPFTLPFALLERNVTDRSGDPHSLKIGLLGMLPPRSVTGLHNGPFRAETRDIVTTARTMVPQLRALGADLVVVMAHSGIAGEVAEDEMENAVVPLAAVPGIDAIIAGHAHQVFPTDAGTWPPSVDARAGMIHGIPVVAPGFWGSHLGVIDLTLRPSPTGGWSLSDARSVARAVARRDPLTGAVRPTVSPDPEILKILSPVRAAITRRTRRAVGNTRRRLHSYFATAAPAPALDLVHRAMLWYGATQLDGIASGSLPLVASTSPFKAGGLAGPGYFTDIPPGPISAEGLTDLYGHPNNLCALCLSGTGLLDWLERAASVFNTILPGGGDQPLVTPKTPAYAFESVAGCDYQIDLAAPPRYDPFGTLLDPRASRIREPRIGGAPVGADTQVLLLTNDYRVTGGGNYPLPAGDGQVFDVAIRVRNLIADYLAANGTYDADPMARWRFRPVPGARATVRSSPRAVAVLDESGANGITPGEISDSGFQAFHVVL
ncbi:metallophosphoesterase [Sinisalibacter lacisalsi]|uniref:2',3'-cyclic-nucleotide 2'-phosphodiesterase n=1 Tax=Sinisalibacter lacisalsi TaxID=1526570 RepID=A0ABQ1QDC4_9RHOB|nr:metallophosphoesterase [Sinisalibacter lacisalsi]GGD23899.1 2',3'-cyclic-nucleotide 2'-phosphodiesterase [Sinisalibacter lacisalsi]